MSLDRFGVLTTYFETQVALSRLRTRADVERRQTRLWREMTPVIMRTPALSRLAGAPLSAMPIALPSDVRERFEQWNTLGLREEATFAAAAEAERGGPGEAAPGVAAGFSTGTSGSRGVFLASKAERAQYLGQALAKVLPWDALLRPRRIMLCLRADNALYRDVKTAGPFQFRFVQLETPFRDLHSAVLNFKPQVLIAPSHVLAGLTRLEGGHPRLDRIFYGAEPMSEEERKWIGGKLGVRPDPIYQATEGFLGAACSHGTLHLNEDTLVIERGSVAGANRFQPIVTDLRRTTQPMVRIQLDDILETVDEPCACGSVLLAVRGVEGRIGDLWRWGEATITPREVETTIAQAVGPDGDWRAVASPAGVEVRAEEALAPIAVAALRSLLQHRGVDCRITAARLTPMEDFKRRRVRWLDA